MIKAFKFRAQAIFSLLEKTPPWFKKFKFEKLFSLFYIISTQRTYIHKQLDPNSCFAKLRAISNPFFFIHPVYIYIYINQTTNFTLLVLLCTMHDKRLKLNLYPAFLLVSRAEPGASGTVFRSHFKNGENVKTLHVHNDYNTLRVSFQYVSFQSVFIVHS
jgi:hypothetical protein